MNKIILPDGRELCYILVRKRVKNINFRAKENRTVWVSASPRVSAKYIEQCLKERAEFFFDAFEKLERREKALAENKQSIRWLGKELSIKVFENYRETAVIDEDECRVFTKDKSAENVLRLVNAAKIERFKSVCAELDGQVRNELEARGFNPPKAVIMIKEMKSRWGSCSYARGHISINLRLSAYPKETILSVFWHEYAHFWHHDHSKNFYRFLLDMFPDYHKYNDVLKSD